MSTQAFCGALLLQADTTSTGYRIGYTIGSWLPFIVIVILALLVILKGYQHGKGD